MSYLTKPGQSSSSSIASPSSSSSASSQKPDRLYVGNLSPTVDEYTLIQIFSKFGKLAKVDFLFHKTGPMKGKPRGFAFVEFISKDDALKALVKLNDKVLRGRKLVVTYASQTAHPEQSQTSTRGPRRGEAPKTTTLSLLKNQGKPKTPAQQIAALEAKLSSMQQSPLSASGSATNSRITSPVLSNEGGEGIEMNADELEREVEAFQAGVEEELSRSGVKIDSSSEGVDTTTVDGKGKAKVIEPRPTPVGLPVRPSQAIIDSAQLRSDESEKKK